MPIIAGVDEVGRGPLAGSVVAGAVILRDKSLIKLIKDSKKCTPKQREKLFALIASNSCWAIGEASVHEIDTLNILQATLLAMKRAVLALDEQPDEAWIDGIHAPDLEIPCQCYIKGDDRVPAIGAASIMAKVTRDRQMEAFGLKYPGFGFENHKGYGTKAHMQAINDFGITPIHRRSFKPISMLVEDICKNP